MNKIVAACILAVVASGLGLKEQVALATHISVADYAAA